MTTCVGVVLLLTAATAMAFHFAPIPNHLELYVVILSPLLSLAAPVAVVVLLFGRRWLLAAVGVGLTAVLIAIALPWFIASKPAAASVPIRVMTINMRYGNADPAELTRLAEGNADVIMAQELTPEAVQRLAAAGLGKAFPYHALNPRPEVSGVGIYSRYPLTEVNGSKYRSVVRARIRVDGIAREPSVLAVHLTAPWPQSIRSWRGDIATFGRSLSKLADDTGDSAVLIGGDFNSTVDMREFRRLLTNGYRDAVWQAGTGNEYTYPANRGFPPVIGIDHVLTRNATAVATSSVEVAGTDHRALLTTIMVPKE
jgi:endonuclease/exonuclease/phosphatase (EEP) superfamily protein YafD